MVLLISSAFKAFICVSSYWHLHRSTWVNRSLHLRERICVPGWTGRFTRVVWWITSFKDTTIIVVKQAIIGLFAW